MGRHCLGGQDAQALSGVGVLTDLEPKPRPVGINDRDTLLKLKEKEHVKLGIPFDSQFHIWDYRYRRALSW
ncbi:hypothetical protein FS749_000526 [Ceratobasidium sp. UAMH 11750]|nr:hypothetical protein FS749_000526 [Ceratobasidium sp. UAMH 11750]